jgi:hypothetical protein
MIKLERAHIEEVRGIRNLDIDFGQENFAISGPNGSGKSGVIDAIEFARSYAVRDNYEGLVFNRSLRGTNAASRVLGVGHILFDIALTEGRGLPASLACVGGLTAPMLIVTVEDEVTGTGTLVHRLIFG